MLLPVLRRPAANHSKQITPAARLFPLDSELVFHAANTACQKITAALVFQHECG